MYIVPATRIEDLTARFHADVTTVNSSMLWYVQENIMRHTATCLQMHGICFEHLL